jgi:5'-3' exonuclease
VVSAYWLWEASKGNQQAITLCYALMLETLERRFDVAFDVPRTESERNALLSQRLQQTEADLERLGDAYAEPDILREQVVRLEQQLRDNGIEPWKMPELDEEQL